MVPVPGIGILFTDVCVAAGAVAGGKVYSGAGRVRCPVLLNGQVLTGPQEVCFCVMVSITYPWTWSSGSSEARCDMALDMTGEFSSGQ